MIDRKFIITATSKKPGGKGYTEADCFVILARDPAAPAAIDAYITECRKLGCDERQLESSLSLYSRVMAYQGTYPSQKAAVETLEEFERLTRVDDSGEGPAAEGPDPTESPVGGHFGTVPDDLSRASNGGSEANSDGSDPTDEPGD